MHSRNWANVGIKAQNSWQHRSFRAVIKNNTVTKHWYCHPFFCNNSSRNVSLAQKFHLQLFPPSERLSIQLFVWLHLELFSQLTTHSQIAKKLESIKTDLIRDSFCHLISSEWGKNPNCELWYQFGCMNKHIHDIRKLAITNKMRTKRNIFDLQQIGCQTQPCMGVYGKRKSSLVLLLALAQYSRNLFGLLAGYKLTGWKIDMTFSDADIFCSLP